MWSPTHVQILIRSAKDLKVKGTDGTNDAFVTIDLGHSKFQTSVKPGSKDFIEWFELCEMKLPKQSNNQTLTLTVYHKNLLSTDQFLGTILIPLSRFLDSQNEQKAHKTKITKCYRLSCKPGQTKTDYRGELEVGITFIVKSECTQSLDEPPLRKLSKDLKHKLSSSTISLHQNQHTFDDYSTGSLRGSYHEEFDQNEITSQHSYKNETMHLRGYSTIKRKVTKSNHYLSPEDANNFLCHIVENVDCSSHKNSFTSQNQLLSRQVRSTFRSNPTSSCRLYRPSWLYQLLQRQVGKYGSGQIHIGLSVQFGCGSVIKLWFSGLFHIRQSLCLASNLQHWFCSAWPGDDFDVCFHLLLLFVVDVLQLLS